MLDIFQPNLRMKMLNNKYLKIISIVVFTAIIAALTLQLRQDQSFIFTSAFECVEDFGATCIDDEGKPRCKTTYLEDCGPDGQKRQITCGPKIGRAHV